MSKTAVVIIHGMGAQRPQETLKDFVKNIAEEEDTIFSNPDRIAENFETRRLTIDKRHTDFFEYYWANLVKLPKTIEIVKWVVGIFFKKPSKRIKVLRIKIFFLLGAIATAIYACWYCFHTHEPISAAILTALSLIGLFIVVRSVLNLFFISIADSIGDVVKYLTPSPQNISARFEIRKKGIDFLRKLHEAERSPGKPKYNRIVVVAHSLGSVVAYDIIHNLWIDYMYKYQPKSQIVDHGYIENMKQIISEEKFSPNDFVSHQREVLKGINALSNPWKITDFVTIGSPLGHGGYLLARNRKEFNSKVDFRELPCCPPILEKGEFTFNEDFEVLNSKQLASIKVINHSSHFSFLRWHNIFFENDFVGGENKVFGKGIRNHAFKPVGGWWTRNGWFASHTLYWERNQKSREIIKDIIF
ncbi:MAG: hypothetical protein LCH67_00485 [Bacteroidetes bacterium]|nr:hypothetical protein [Bacteroidota bacterium]